MLRRHTKFKDVGRIVAVVATAVVIAACSDSNDDSSSVIDTSDNGDSTSVIDTSDNGDDTSAIDTSDNGDDTAVTSSTVDPASFVAGALTSSEIIDCTLSDGTETQCYELVTTAIEKSTDQIGPFCPSSTTSTAAEGGVWLDGTSVYDADGDFFLNLPNIYGDLYPPADSWILYDENNELRVTDSQEACEAAARPDVDAEYQSHCVECSLDYLDTADIVLTYTIPVTPIRADVVGTLSDDAGISLNGYQIAARAPVEDILSNWTIAAFDDCGGHINPNDGYHYHASTGGEGCNSGGTDSDGHPSLMGFAMDGYGIYGTLDDSDAEANSLDQCNGTEDDTRGYHYHTSSAELNEHIACFSGVTVESNDTAGGDAGGDGQGGGQGGGPQR